MREMHEIESQKSALPPIPASAIKDQLHDDAWAQQYLQDGGTFHVNFINFTSFILLLIPETCRKPTLIQYGTRFPHRDRPIRILMFSKMLGKL